MCCILSLFQDIHIWNRKNFSRYYEVFLDVSLDTLVKRDSKNLYKPALMGKSSNVVGIDIEFTHPLNPDLVMQNKFEDTRIPLVANRILGEAREKYGI